MFPMKKIVFVFIALCFLESCSTVPITDRKRLNFVSDAQVLPISFQQYTNFLKENKISKDKEKIRELNEIGKNISLAVDLFMRSNKMNQEADSYKWEFNLIENQQLNAWCLPGGKVVFYTGILPVAKNRDGIAAIMGHEIAHAFAKHGQERMSSSQLQQLGGLAVDYGTRKKKEREQQIWNAAYGLGSKVSMLKFSRKHETEADKLGMVFMIMAGYNPEEAVNVWIRMSQLGTSKTPEFLSTHPSNETRIQTLKAFLPEAKSLAKKYS
jgi:predicted Zn-dependent protease